MTAHRVIPSDTMAHGTMLLLISLALALGPAVGFYGGSMTFTPGNTFPDGSVEVNPVLKFCIVFVLVFSCFTCTISVC